MTNHLRFASFLLLVSFVVGTYGQQVWDYEKQRTLAEMTSLRREIVNHRHPIFSDSEAGDFALNNSAVTSRVKLRYMGEKRELSVAKRRLLAGMADSYALDPASTRALVEEVLFKEGDQEYWIPTKKRVISVLEERLKTGDEVMLYIDLVGAYRTKGKWEWVFTVNELVRAAAA
jgi:hypothetical protein